MEAESEMSWSTSARNSPIIVTARPGANLDAIRMQEMEGAAAAVVAMLVANREMRKQRSLVNSQASVVRLSVRDFSQLFWLM
jgi:hypothetical protein